MLEGEELPFCNKSIKGCVCKDTHHREPCGRMATCTRWLVKGVLQNHQSGLSRETEGKDIHIPVHIHLHKHIHMSFPSGASDKEPTCQCRRDAGSIPGSGRSLEGRHGNPLQYSYMENPKERGAGGSIGSQRAGHDQSDCPHTHTHTHTHTYIHITYKYIHICIYHIVVFIICIYITHAYTHTHIHRKRHLFQGLKVKESEFTQLCPTHCDPMDCSLPGSSIHGIFQARILEWVAISFSRGSSPPGDLPHPGI